jgi:hypothetical protein
MSLFSRWLRGRLWGCAPDTQSDTSRNRNPAADLLEKARALARDGKLHEASRVYSQIPRNHATVEIWLEHAELLLAIGDRFGAGSNSTRVLELEPENSRALAIRREVLALEDADRES